MGTGHHAQGLGKRAQARYERRKTAAVLEEQRDDVQRPDERR
jgi:hypothetical protein